MRNFTCNEMPENPHGREPLCVFQTWEKLLLKLAVTKEKQIPKDPQAP